MDYSADIKKFFKGEVYSDEKTLRAAREKFPEKTIVVAFHAHLYSRTRDLMKGFGAALALADEVLVAPIYPAREAPIPGPLRLLE